MLQIEQVIAVENLKEAVTVWEKNRKYKLLAAGTDLIPRIRSGAYQEAVCLLDISRVAELKGITKTEDEIRIGALTSHQEIAENEVIRKEYRALAQACGQVGSLQIRNTATIGGNICNASPAADSLPPLAAFDAEVTLVDGQGTKRMLLETYLQKKWNKDPSCEGILRSIHIPRQEMISGYQKIGGRNALVIAIASCALVQGKDGYRAAFGSVDPWAKRCREAEEYLNSLDGDWTGDACLGQKNIKQQAVSQVNAEKLNSDKLENILSECLHPISDVRASKEYRLAVAGGLLKSVMEDLEKERARI